jgi:hypothetical protein
MGEVWALAWRIGLAWFFVSLMFFIAYIAFTMRRF